MVAIFDKTLMMQEKLKLSLRVKTVMMKDMSLMILIKQRRQKHNIYMVVYLKFI